MSHRRWETKLKIFQKIYGPKHKSTSAMLAVVSCLRLAYLFPNQQNEFRLQKHFVCYFTKKCIWYNRILLHHARQRPKSLCQHNKALLQGEKCKVLDWSSQLPDLNTIKHVFYLLKRRLKWESPQSKQKLKEVAVQVWKSITKEECTSLLMSVGHQFEAVIASKGYAAKY